jgi:hypothetical protein
LAEGTLLVKRGEHDDSAERVAIERPQLTVRVGRDRRGARIAVHQRQLAEAAARAVLGDLLCCACDGL